MPAPTIMGDPAAWGPDLNAYLADLEARVLTAERPDSPKPVFACLRADLPSAVTYIHCVVFITDLNILAHSDGTAWRREDTGAIA